MKKRINLFILTLIILTSCRESFDPPVKSGQSNYLVVEGFINADGRTNIALSRTAALRDSAAIRPEQSAAVTIMGENNVDFPLIEIATGYYQSDSLTLDKNEKYHLNIKTADGKEYFSDDVAVKQTPPIDSVSWQNENDGVHIYVNTHDGQNSTLYYKWDYIETWEIDSHYGANYKYFRGSEPDGSKSYITQRDIDEVRQMAVCWQNISSTNIHISSSARLASDVISLEPVINIPRGSEKISVRYSILVKQYALDKQAYAFYQLIKKNTESIGSIFDSQPSDVAGNIHSTGNPGEKAIGYITVGTEQSKRIFITSDQVGPQWGYDQGCETLYVVNVPDSLNAIFGGGGYIPYSEKPLQQGYYSVTSNCADCRERGGTIKPGFW